MASSSQNCIFAIVVALSLIASGYSQCYEDSIKVKQEKTSAMVKGKPEWNVTYTNTCDCPMYDLTVNCTGFESTEAVPALDRVLNFCLVNNGSTIEPDEQFSFTYAWDHTFPLNVVQVDTGFC